MKIHLFEVGALLFGLVGQSQATQVHDITLPKNSERQNSFASCLLVKDDNHRLIEWMAYHYHTLPLRRLIVMVDPQSQTDPRAVLDRWSDKIDVDVWLDKDVFSEKEHQDDREMAVQHSALHQAFNVKCIQTLKDEGRKWTLMTDADEYLYLNPKAWDPSDSLYLSDVEPIDMSESGAMMKLLNKVNLSDERFHGQEWEACFPITRLQLGDLESSSAEIEENFPKTLEPSLLPSDFDTFRLRHYEANTPGKSETPGKTLINLSKLPDDYQKHLIGNPHHPIDVLCDRENVFLPEEKNHFLASHMLRTKDQIAAKEDDSRFYSEAIAFAKRMKAGGRITDELRPWLSSFVDNVGKEEAHRLLLSAGQVQTPTFDLPKCSMNFFGLPRSFESLSLPSIVKNVLLTNAKYICDIYVHFYSIETETEGRLNVGGTHDITAVYELESAVKLAAAHAGHNAPTVKIVEQTKEQFDEKYRDLVTHYLTSEDPNSGKPTYFPWKDENYNTKSIENIVMQWNSLQSCWQMMEKHAMNVGIDYKRVAYFRLDAFYAFPVDIYKINKDTYDYSNRYAVMPGFAKYPVNDRMFYGPSKAVKIWATERFDRLQHYISSSIEDGYGMHSERYVGNGLVPSIKKETGYSVIENNDICFFRTRASDILLLNDCSDVKGGVTRGIQDVDTKRLVEEIINRDCEITSLDDSGRFLGLDCREPEDNTFTSLVSVRMLNDTPEPTSKPTPNQPENDTCVNDETFEMSIIRQEPEEKNCTWVAESPNRRCRFIHRDSTIGAVFCPVTCDLCMKNKLPTCADVTTSFLSRTRIVTCENWVAADLSRCDLLHNNRVIGNYYCRATCNRCSTSQCFDNSSFNAVMTYPDGLERDCNWVKADLNRCYMPHKTSNIGSLFCPLTCSMCSNVGPYGCVDTNYVVIRSETINCTVVGRDLSRCSETYGDDVIGEKYCPDTCNQC